MEAFLASLGTLFVVAGYMVVKRMRASSCSVDNGCLQCESPAIELQKQQTERIDEIFEMIKRLKPLKIPPQETPSGRVSPISLTQDHFSVDRPTTTGEKKVGNIPSSC